MEPVSEAAEEDSLDDIYAETMYDHDNEMRMLTKSRSKELGWVGRVRSKCAISGTVLTFGPGCYQKEQLLGLLGSH